MVSPMPIQEEMEIILLGTGTSAALPIVPCLTAAEEIADLPCRSCRECVSGVEGGLMNERGNTGAIVRRRGADGEWKTIVIDIGKTFRYQASKFFRKHGVKRIDAVILTHGHSDAINGMDDLRAWTMPPAAQAGESIPVYLSSETFDSVAEQFPYLVDAKKATGGGDVPSLDFRIFGSEVEELDVLGIKVVPLAVHHGKYFSAPRVSQANSASSSVIDLPSLRNPTLQMSTTHTTPAASTPSSPTRAAAPVFLKEVELPFLCYGFVFDGQIVYLSDINYIPEKTWDRLMRAIEGGRNGITRTPPGSPKSGGSDSGSETSAVYPHPNGRSSPFAKSYTSTGLASVIPPTSLTRPSPNTPLPILILDCLFLKPHPSHLSFIQAAYLSSLLAATRSYLIGFTHPWSHWEWDAACREIDGSRGVGKWRGGDGKEEDMMRQVEESVGKQGMEGEWEEVKRWGGWVRPGWDGLRVAVGRAGEVREL